MGNIDLWLASQDQNRSRHYRLFSRDIVFKTPLKTPCQDVKFRGVLKKRLESTYKVSWGTVLKKVVCFQDGSPRHLFKTPFQDTFSRHLFKTLMPLETWKVSWLYVWCLEEITSLLRNILRVLKIWLCILKNVHWRLETIIVSWTT